MKLHTTTAFVLGSIPLKERDRVVILLTREAGKKRGVARGARRLRSAFAGALEPMSEVEVVYFEREGRELVSFNSVAVVHSSFSLTRDLPRALLLSSMAESLATFVSDSDPAEPFYRLAQHAMASLSAGIEPRRVAAYFDIWVLKLSGVLPSASDCARCGGVIAPGEPLWFDESLPGFVHDACRAPGAVRLSEEGRRLLAAFLASPLPGPDARPAALQEVAAVARRARRHFLGHELKSARVLAEVL
jgi:DNA repair protein RecO (recombination protein O)